MDRKYLCSILTAALAVITYAQGGTTGLIIATDTASIGDSGPASTKNLLSALGTDNGASESFAVAQFDTSKFGISSVQSVDSLTLQLTQADSVSSIGGQVNFYITTDNETSLATGSTPTFQPNDPTGTGIGTQFQTTYLLDTRNFLSNGTGAVDDYTFYLYNQLPAVQKYLLNTIKSAGTLRFLVAPAGSSGSNGLGNQVAATWAGISNPTPNPILPGNVTLTPPQLSIGYTPVPETSTAAL
ncbi:MAG: hypothetical protein JOY96_08055 [Verrucomicrobia bacterium]|nr:hypothetical protein [Verrucomicrobiota bacterium]